MKPLKFLLAMTCGLLASCAIITVNVYFPEKAVKDAYKSVDEMMIKSGDKGAPVDRPVDQKEKAPAEKPVSSLFRKLPAISFAATAHAAENTADELAVELASMPEVTKAYEEINRHLPRLRELLAAGVVGISNQGLVSIRDKARIKPADETLVKTENDSRKTIITGMAKAILKINKKQSGQQPDAALLGKAAATYAEAKRDEAKPGWWIQLPNGKWVQK